MNWEVPLLLGFLLLFSAWVSFPLTDQYFFIDSHGIKHHILTPEISDPNTAANLTNILFTRYENPWIEYAGNMIFVAGIFIILQQEPVRLYLRNRIWTLISFNLEKYPHSHLRNQSKIFNLVYRNRNNDLAMVPSLIFFTYKELKKSSKVFSVIFLLLILCLFYTQNAYAATAQFVDGNQLTGLSTNCASRSTVATLNTSLPAASSSTPNIIIATTDYVSSDAGSEQVDASSGLYRGGNVRSQLQYSFFLGTSGEGNHYTYIYEDSTAGANPTYTIEACLSANAANAESKILAIQGLESSFTDGVNVSTSAGFFVDIETKLTDLTVNDHIIIAQVQIDFDGTATIAAGDIELRDSADTMLAENQFEIRGASGAVGDGSAITLIAVVPNGSANASYKIAVREPAGGGIAGAEAKILALKAAGGEEYFSDGGSVSVAASATQLTSLTSSFSNNEKIVVISASQFDDTDSVAETLDITSGHEIRENSVAKSGNQMAIGELATSGNAGEGIRHTLIWNGNAGGASLGYESRADASATGYNGESKLLAFSVQDHLLPSDTPSLSETVLMNQDRTATDTPIISETVLMNQDRTATDTPILSEVVVMTKIIVTSDTPSLSETVLMNQDRTATDTPIISETVLMNQDRTATDTPILSEVVVMTKIIVTSDTPSLSETVLMNQDRTAIDTPTLSETVIVNGILSAADTPFISESVTLKQSLFLTDNPTISDIAVAQKISIKSGGGSGDITAPSIGSSTLTSLDDPMSGSGVIIGENDYLDSLSQVRPIKVGEKINLRFDVNEDQGLNNIAHASLYIGKGASTSEVSESETYIRFEKGKQLEVSDPNKLFSDVSFALLKKDTNNFVFRFDMTFAKPMEKSSMLFRTWDLSRNVDEVWYVDTLQVIEKDMSPPGPLNFDTKNKSVNTPSAISADQRFVVEKWAGYNAESISDSDLLKLMGIISSQSEEGDNEVTIPSWFKNNVAGWVLEGKVSFTEFVDAIEYLYEKRIM